MTRPNKEKQKIALEHSISQDSDSDDKTVGFLSDTETDSDSDCTLLFFIAI